MKSSSLLAYQPGMGLVARISAVAASLLCLSCHRPAIEPSQSLVAAKNLPTAEVLSRETIQINRGLGSWPSAPGSLEYELRPDGSLTVTHKKFDRDFHQITVGQQTFRLAQSAAMAARRLLWRLRPEPLQGITVEALPIGCPHPPIDAPPEFFVDFISEGPKPGIADDKLGIVFLPYADDCRTKGAAEARSLIGTVLQSFPASNAAAEYETEVAKWKAKLRS